MDMNMETASPFGAVDRKNTSAVVPKGDPENRMVKAEEERAEQSLIEEVREKGFAQFVKELEEKKKEELREKILRAMGLSEQDLENMPAEQRAQIEEMIAREIVERTAANAQMNGSSAAVVFQKTSLKVQYSEINVAANIASNMGLGPLLALQETDALEAQSTAVKERKEDLLNG